MFQPRTLIMALPLLVLLFLVLMMGERNKTDPGATPSPTAIVRTGELNCTYEILQNGTFVVTCEDVPSS